MRWYPVDPHLLPRAAPRRLLDPAVRAAARAGLSPNAVTALGFAGNGIAALLAARGWLPAAGGLMLVSSLLDLVDGALARTTDRVSRFGAVFDAVLDRYAEAVVLLGIVVYQAERQAHLTVALAFVALTGSVLVSDVRARAETLGFTLREGLFTRAERVALTALALIATAWWGGALTAALSLLAVLANVTALQRLVVVCGKLAAHHTAGEREGQP
ncbi:MAG: CDP-alcohol phosphatidyltransferase family protein [Chloroflexota bacterium]